MDTFTCICYLYDFDQRAYMNEQELTSHDIKLKVPNSLYTPWPYGSKKSGFIFI